MCPIPVPQIHKKCSVQMYRPMSVATQRKALGTVKSTGGDYNSEIFSDVHPKLEFELVFLKFPRVHIQAQ